MIINEDNEYETIDDADLVAPEDDDYDNDGVDAYPSEAQTIVVHRALNVQPSASTQRCNLFQIKALFGPNKACMVIIDSGSCRNLANKELCAKLKLKYLPHLYPYYIQWLSDNGEMKEFSDVFPEEVPAELPPLRGIEHQIDLISGASLPNRAPYRTNHEETKEIQKQVQALLDKEEIKELEAQVLSLKKDLEKRHEGKSALDKMLSLQQSPNDKSGLGFNSNNKNKSKSKSNKKKGQDKVKDPAKLVCFKCKVEGHHVRSCPLKKKKHLSEKQQGKRPQGQGQAHARPQVEDRPLPKKNQHIVPQEKKSIKKRKGNTCYLCRVKGHFASSCLSGTLSNPIIVNDDYSLSKDKDGDTSPTYR
ncbi:hypothetical protein QYE76_042422 [Lolium multiflorum]|uniref:CCHC-type domain-containing protein n=1 Tax=Lolium multiflorum TaxID=4521 RepID=A0AAD8WV35_LOLMU|nr:hypothetical protein QYE76_042422 [Lolium multiflorum]